MSLPLLLEIGTEEIPDWMIPEALENLRLLFEKLEIPHESIAMDATPGQFFSFLTAFLLAYEPAKRLARLNIELNSSLIGARKLLEIVGADGALLRIAMGFVQQDLTD